MNIVHILDNLDRGGAQTVLRSLVAGLSARGHRQHIVCLSGKLNVQVVDSMRQAGASVEIIGRPRLYALIGLWRIVRELRRRRPDLVHTELPWGDLIGRAAARIAGTRPIVSTVTARYVDKPRLQLMLDRATIGWADRVVFQSAEIVPFSIAHEGVRPDQVRCIPNGVEPDGRDRSAAAAALRREHAAGVRTIIGMVARLHRQKAHADLVAAFARIAAASPDCALWLVGDGPERARLTSQVERLGLERRVCFAGDRNDVRDWIAAMDIFVHPTFFEGLPLAVLEAMSAAKPVIATGVDGLRTLITPGIDGWLVAPGDVDALAAAIRHVMQHPEEATRVARAGAERVTREFAAERVTQAYDELFRSLITPPVRPCAASGPK
jgi:glycosyltransferase involved in cell wall biosynthesis